jgi:serine/threonine-protein kinase RsbW
VASRLRTKAELDNLTLIRHFVEERATALEADPAVVPDLLLAVNEAATNIVLHGYRGQPGVIEIEIRRKGDSVVICLRDEAPPFDPRLVPPPDLTLPLEERPLGGLGIYLISQLMDDVTHRVMSEGGNELTLLKRDSFENIKRGKADENQCE